MHRSRRFCESGEQRQRSTQTLDSYDVYAHQSLLAATESPFLAGDTRWRSG